MSGGGPYGGVVWVMAGGEAFILLWRVGVRVPAWYFAAVMREGSHDVDVSINQHSSCPFFGRSFVNSILMNGLEYFGQTCVV